MRGVRARRVVLSVVTSVAGAMASCGGDAGGDRADSGPQYEAGTDVLEGGDQNGSSNADADAEAGFEDASPDGPDPPSCPPMSPVDPHRAHAVVWSGFVRHPDDAVGGHKTFFDYFASDLLVGQQGVVWMWNAWNYGKQPVGHFCYGAERGVPVGAPRNAARCPWAEPDLPFLDLGFDAPRLLMTDEFFVETWQRGSRVYRTVSRGEWTRSFPGMRTVGVGEAAIFLAAAGAEIYRVELPDGTPEVVEGSEAIDGTPLDAVLDADGITVGVLKQGASGSPTRLGRLERGVYREFAPLEAGWRPILRHGDHVWCSDRSSYAYLQYGYHQLHSVHITTGATEVVPGDVILGADEHYLYFTFHDELRRRQHCSGQVQTIGVAPSSNAALHEGAVYFLTDDGGELSALPLPPP